MDLGSLHLLHDLARSVLSTAGNGVTLNVPVSTARGDQFKELGGRQLQQQHLVARRGDEENMFCANVPGHDTVMVDNRYSRDALRWTDMKGGQAM